MPRAFAEISFTESVKAAQSRYGSRDSNRAFEMAEDPRNELTIQDAQFIESRDSFYQATVSETSWPYVQHRGGPGGFLRVLDTRTLGYADFRGNMQYISVGNLTANARIAMILMDYTNRRRMKIWGTTRIVHREDEPEIIQQLEDSSYRGRVERGVLINIEAIEWNCPQHITPRFSALELEARVAPLAEENRKLHEQLALAQSGSSIETPMPQLGDGPLELVISGMRLLTPQVRAYELRHLSGGVLPAVEAGSHLRVPVMLPNGEASTRIYSISSNPSRRDAYEIAVLREDKATGGSAFIHQWYALGMTLRCGMPRNDFALHSDARATQLIAGGIGITPIKAMALSLRAAGREFTLHYVGRSAHEMAYLDRMQREFGEQIQVYSSDDNRINVSEILLKAEAETLFYVCGPQRLIAAVQQQASDLGIAAERIRVERFNAPDIEDGQRIEIELRRSGIKLEVAPNQSILSAIEDAGIAVPSDCRTGSCGSCVTKVMEGLPMHKDVVLSERERVDGNLMCICVSRARSPKLVLDL